jgi:hypothetical protein
LLEATNVAPEKVCFITVWIDMLSADNPSAAEEASSIFEPFPHVHQYHDPHRHVGKAVAASIGAPDHIAWDMYLLYPPDNQWQQTAPTPLDWVHQLGQEMWADRSRFRWGEKLAEALPSMMQAWLKKL